ncbi:MAG: hypothetical protein HYV07_12785 [Deltaproteobacteria bacterium]|nr:hypothetical protein [Deltaproteobacteria bacterium]
MGTIVGLEVGSRENGTGSGIERDVGIAPEVVADIEVEGDSIRILEKNGDKVFVEIVAAGDAELWAVDSSGSPVSDCVGFSSRVESHFWLRHLHDSVPVVVGLFDDSPLPETAVLQQREIEIAVAGGDLGDRSMLTTTTASVGIQPDPDHGLRSGAIIEARHPGPLGLVLDLGAKSIALATEAVEGIDGFTIGSFDFEDGFVPTAPDAPLRQGHGRIVCGVPTRGDARVLGVVLTASVTSPLRWEASTHGPACIEMTGLSAGRGVAVLAMQELEVTLELEVVP